MFHVKHTRFDEVVRKCLADFQFVVGRFEIGWLQRIPRRTDQHAAISDGKLAPVRRAHQAVAFNIRHARALMWASRGVGYEFSFGGLGDDELAKNLCGTDRNLGGVNFEGFRSPAARGECARECGRGAQQKEATATHLIAQGVLIRHASS